MKNSGANVIDVHVTTLAQVFDEMDPAPFRERDLNPRVEEFIVSWSRELQRHQAHRLATEGPIP